MVLLSEFWLTTQEWNFCTDLFLDIFFLFKHNFVYEIIKRTVKCLLNYINSTNFIFNKSLKWWFFFLFLVQKSCLCDSNFSNLWQNDANILDFNQKKVRKNRIIFYKVRQFFKKKNSIFFKIFKNSIVFPPP